MAKDKKHPSGAGKGMIQAGGDARGYLGHFRNAETIKKGHNQGDPSGMAFAPAAVPQTAVAQPRMRPAAAANPAAANPAMNPLSNPQGFEKATGVALRRPGGTGTTSTKTTGPVAPARPRRSTTMPAPVASPRDTLASAVNDVRATRTAVRNTLRPGASNTTSRLRRPY